MAEKEGEKKRKKKAIDVEVVDWRETLFHWRGVLHDGLHWHGVWVGASEGRLPNLNEFASSLTTFDARLSRPCDFGNEVSSSFSCSVDSSYLLDNGDGLVSYDDLQEDEEYSNILFVNPSSSCSSCSSSSSSSSSCSSSCCCSNRNFALAAASGNNEFGSFLSFGCLQRNEVDGVVTLTLARRYLQPGDEREGFTNELQLQSFLMQAVAHLAASGDNSQTCEEKLFAKDSPLWQQILPYRAKEIHAKKKTKNVKAL